MENSIANQSYAVDIAGLEKSYGAFAALKGVDFRLREGEVHALMGQNGAGKSTLIKVLAGAEPASAGVIKIFGAEKTFSSPADAAAAGVSVVYQDLSLVPGMTVADNLFLGREPTGLCGVLSTFGENFPMRLSLFRVGKWEIFSSMNSCFTIDSNIS